MNDIRYSNPVWPWKDQPGYVKQDAEKKPTVRKKPHTVPRGKFGRSRG